MIKWQPGKIISVTKGGVNSYLLKTIVINVIFHTSLGLEFFGTASILLEAYIRKLINKKDLMESLRELAKNMWLSPAVIAELVRQAEEVEK